MATTTAVVNEAHTSKINWVNALSALFALAASLGFVIPAEYQKTALEVVSIATPVLTMILRTFMTVKR